MHYSLNPLTASTYTVLYMSEKMVNQTNQNSLTRVFTHMRTTSRRRCSRGTRNPLTSKRPNGVKDEQEYIVVREKIHRNTAESTNTRVKWWSILQAVVLFAVVGWQVMYLKVRVKYFEKDLAKFSYL
jgi:hypothetical protein